MIFANVCNLQEQELHQNDEVKIIVQSSINRFFDMSSYAICKLHLIFGFSFMHVYKLHDLC